MEQNIQKSDEQAQKEDDLRKLHDLRRDRLKRMRELDLIDLMYAKNQEFLKTVLTLIDSYVIDKHFPLTHNMKQHEESWDQFRIGLDTTIEQWKDYFVLNMYHKYSSF